MERLAQNLRECLDGSGYCNLTQYRMLKVLGEAAADAGVAVVEVGETFTWDGTAVAYTAIYGAAQARGIVCVRRGRKQISLQCPNRGSGIQTYLWGAVLHHGSRVTFHRDGAVSFGGEGVEP